MSRVLIFLFWLCNEEWKSPPPLRLLDLRKFERWKRDGDELLLRVGWHSDVDEDELYEDPASVVGRGRYLPSSFFLITASTSTPWRSKACSVSSTKLRAASASAIVLILCFELFYLPFSLFPFPSFLFPLPSSLRETEPYNSTSTSSAALVNLLDY